MIGAGRRLTAIALASAALAPPAAAFEPWLALPPTPTLPLPRASGTIAAEGAGLHYAEFGAGEPVILLHGGLAHSGWWGLQAPALARRFRVVALDTRGHGRSTPSSLPLSYELLARDVALLMDALGLRRASIVGWSDGAIAGLMLAMAEPGRVERLFAFGANYDRAGVRPSGGSAPVFKAYAARCAVEFRALSPQPGSFGQLRAQLGRMWAAQPNIARARLAAITARSTICDGEHDEIIARAHTEDLARAIPGAALVIEPGVSHFAMLQGPDRFTADVLRAMGDTEAR